MTEWFIVNYFSQIISVSIIVGAVTSLTKVTSLTVDVVWIGRSVVGAAEKFDPLNVDIKTFMSVIRKTPMMLRFENLLAAFI